MKKLFLTLALTHLLTHSLSAAVTNSIPQYSLIGSNAAGQDLLWVWSGALKRMPMTNLVSSLGALGNFNFAGSNRFIGNGITNVINPDVNNAASFAGGNATISFDGTVANSTDLTSKNYVDSQLTSKLNLTGGNLTGGLTFDDDQHNIGAVASGRPKHIYVAEEVYIGGAFHGSGASLTSIPISAVTAQGPTNSALLILIQTNTANIAANTSAIAALQTNAVTNVYAGTLQVETPTLTSTTNVILDLSRTNEIFKRVDGSALTQVNILNVTNTGACALRVYSGATNTNCTVSWKTNWLTVTNGLTLSGAYWTYLIPGTNKVFTAPFSRSGDTGFTNILNGGFSVAQ